MKNTNLTYPVALGLIIVVALLLMYGDFIKPQQVDLAKYQALCTEYLNAPPGKYRHAQMQLLVDKINYLLPADAKDLTLPVEQAVKTCAQQLSAKLKTGQP